ncbi:hypothetical protein [Streptomyces sp. NPDC101455]|uniref:hypothetical protein n=1 Tax=Streptomyces sp. NPDC101455 TaxID=3366142 RepID=UPI003819721E
MSTDDGQQVARLPSNRDHIFHHGPVKRRSTTQHVEIVAFTGNEESDVLHAAGDWMKEHPMAQIKAINLVEEDLDAPGPRTWVLEMAIDHDAAHF